MRRALAAILLTLSASAHAFVGGDGKLVVANGAQPRVARNVDSDRIGSWSALRDRDTGVVTRLWGDYVVVPGSIADAAIAERAARTFLAQHLAELAPGARMDQFTLVANRVDDGKRTVAFVQTWNGLRVVGGQVHVVFGSDRLFFAGSDALPHVSAAMPARGNVVLPIIRGKGDIEYRVARETRTATEDIYVAPDGSPIARKSRVAHATSTLQLDVAERHPMGTRVLAPASQANLVVDGNATTTATDGTFSFAASSASVVTSLTGTVVRVMNQNGAPATITLTANDGVPISWSLVNDEFGDAQLAAYVYVNNAKAVAKRMHPTLAWLGNQLEVQVNIDDACNAFALDDSIHFYRATAQCQNTARVADVVHHEFGHSFHFASIIAGVGSRDFSTVEGLADFFAATMTGDSGIGRGIRYDDSPTRELDPLGVERTYPRDYSNTSPHASGLIIGGALFDLRKQLIAKRGAVDGIAAIDKIFVGILQRAPDLTGAYTAALVADDDDGNLGNGTPNGCTIESAFGRHGLVGVGFRETSLRSPVIEGQRISVTVDTPAGTTCAPAQVVGMKMVWRTTADATLTEVPMTAVGDTWAAELPAVTDGTILEFQIAATMNTQETLLFPENVADPFYQYFVGTATTIWCEHFDADPLWKQNETNEWEVATEQPTTAFASGDPTTAYAGTTWLGTDLRGDGRYRPDILASIQTPAIDTSRFARVHLQFRRWLVIEDANLDIATIRVNGAQIWSNAKNEAFTLDHIDREWRFVDFDLTPHATEPLSVQFTLASDPLRNLGGWNLDEVCIVGLDKIPMCGDSVVDVGEDCDETDRDVCNTKCQMVTGGGGCCSASRNGWTSMLFGLGLVQFVMIFARRRWSSRRPSRSVSERMPK